MAGLSRLMLDEPSSSEKLICGRLILEAFRLEVDSSEKLMLGPLGLARVAGSSSEKLMLGPLGVALATDDATASSTEVSATSSVSVSSTSTGLADSSLDGTRRRSQFPCITVGLASIVDEVVA